MHNLYFVAYGKHIYVYVPQFPSQRISEHPALVFTSQPSSPHLHGRIDEGTPHAINNLILQFLGNEEVVAVVRDDGDVDAFLVRHIVQAINRRSEPDSTIGVEGDEIKPFFQSNVGESAWGLAIHSEARILATSSNAHEVRVFKFGLLQADDDDDEASPEEDDEQLPDADSIDNGRTKERKTDVTHHVLNGDTNIPYIAFCNAGDDSEARWLLTTDISGVCRVMDLHALQAVQAFRFGRSLLGPGGFDRNNAGWALMFLDRRSFQFEDDTYTALGATQGEESFSPKVHRNGDIWDLSTTVRRFKESSEPFTHHQKPSRADLRWSSRRDVDMDQDTIVLTPSIDRSESMDGSDSSDGGASVEIEIDGLEHMHDEDDDGGIDVEVSDAMQEYYADNGNDNESQAEGYEDPDRVMSLDTAVDYSDQDSLADEDGGGAERFNEDDLDEEPSNDDLRNTELHDTDFLYSEPESDEEDADLIDDGLDPEDEGTEDTIPFTSFYNGDSIVGNEPQFSSTSTSLCAELPCPILHASVRNIYLLQPSSESSNPFVAPMLGFANPLRQTVHQQYGDLRFFERLNMNAYIPSLGIVVLASQKGRAVVLSLTKLKPTSRYPKELGHHKKKANYCMRLECILPFEHQEKANQRPCHPLHGIAVGPLQGSEGLKPEGTRWRLMMMYQDHSILSYEIGRRKKAGSRDSGVDVGSLVV